MRKILFVLSLAGFTLIQPAASAAVKQDAAAKDITKKILNANDWKDVLGLLKNKIPNNLIKEMETSTKNLPFPIIRKQKEGLLVTDPNGNHLFMELGKEGTIFFNGKEWKVRPLASTKSEIDRVLKFLELERAPKSTWLDWLIPSAHAVGNQGESVGAISHMAAVAAKAYHCGEETVTDDEKQFCVLVAAPMHPSAEPNGKYSASELYWPVDYSCPKKKREGELVLVCRDNRGYTLKIKVQYKAGTIVGTDVSLSESAKKGYEFGIDFNAKKVFERGKLRDSTKEDVDFGTVFAKKGDLVNIAVCEADKETRSRYSEALRENKSNLSVPQLGELESEPGSSENQNAL